MMQNYQTLSLNISRQYTSEIIDIKINEKGLVDKSDNSRVRDNSDLDKKIATLATKTELSIQVIFVVKVTLKMKEHKTIQYFISQSINILKQLLILIKLCNNHIIITCNSLEIKRIVYRKH